MDDKLFDILSNSNKDIDNQKLMDYLAGKLSEDRRHRMDPRPLFIAPERIADPGAREGSGQYNLEP